MDVITKRLRGILDDGRTIKLSDGSLFQVDPYDQLEVSTWATSSDIELARNKDRVFNYTLINRDRDVWARATKLK